MNTRYKELIREFQSDKFNTNLFKNKDELKEKNKSTIEQIRPDIYQSNFITQSYLPFTKTESNLMAIILATLKENTYQYVWNIKELLQILKIEGNNYMQLVNSLNGLFNKTIVIKHERETEKIRLLSRIKYVDDDKIMWNDDVTLTISQEIAPHLYDLKKLFTVYETASYLRLGSLIAKKMYTVLAQYKAIGYITISTDEIQRLLGTNFKRFAALMSNEIKPAIDEIERLTNVNNITITPLKTGRKITHYKFEFDWHTRQLEIPLLNSTMNNNQLRAYERLITDYWLSNNQAKKVVENLPTDEINRTLHQIMLQKSDIKNVGAYTINIFKKKYAINFN